VRDLDACREIMGLPPLVSAGLILLVHSHPFLLIVGCLSAQNYVCVSPNRVWWACALERDTFYTAMGKWLVVSLRSQEKQTTAKGETRKRKGRDKLSEGKSLV
jgi:hypothetical protein